MYVCVCARVCNWLFGEGGKTLHPVDVSPSWCLLHNFAWKHLYWQLIVSQIGHGVE